MTADARAIGDYRLVAGLGTGGMARVYLAISQKAGGFQKLLVLKTLRDELAEDPEFRRMFLDEARVAARLNHPNVVHTYEVGQESDGRIFIAMEYLEGQAFSAVLKRVGRDAFPLPVGLRILADTLAGLHYAHELSDFDGRPLGLVHRDVSPQNVFVLYGGFSKILDFGIAKGALSVGQTKSGVIKGKAGYMAPEQITGVPIDRRADVFAVGVMLWELLAQRRFVASTDDEVAALARRISDKDVGIREVASGAPPELLAICERAMAFAPDARYPTAEAMKEEIEAYLTKVGGGDARAVAACLDSPFKEDRSKVRRVVEEGMRVLDTSSSIPSLSVGRTATARGPDSASSRMEAPEETSEPAQSAEPFARTISKTKGNKMWVIASTAVAAITLTVIVVVVGRSSAPSAAPAEPAVTAAAVAPKETVEAAATAPPISDTSTTRTKITATPKHAVMFLDGVRVTNPFDGKLTPGAHEVRAEAPGFRAAARTIATSDGPEIVVALEALPISHPTATPLPPTRPKKPKRDIDDTDPYR